MTADLTLPEITFDASFAAACPRFRVGVIRCDVTESVLTDDLYVRIDHAAEQLKSEYDVTAIKQWPAIRSTREAYKRCGKDPNRYRPASEQLCRRIINGLGVYRVLPLVDLGNLISITGGYAIGMFDYTLVREPIALRIGTAEDAFEGIGRGSLNIEGLPAYCDAVGPFGTPTSDHERTKVSAQTHELLIFINDFGTQEYNDGLPDILAATLEFSEKLIRKYCTVKAYCAGIISLPK